MTRLSRLYSRIYPRINARITAPFLLIVVIVAAIGVLIVTRLVAGSIQERLDNQLGDSAQAAANAIVEIEREQLAVLRLMVFTDGVADALRDADVNALDPLLRTIAANERIDDVIVFDTTGSAIFRLSREPVYGSVAYNVPTPPDVSTWESVQRVNNAQNDIQGDKHIELVHVDDQPVLYFGAPVIDSDGVPVGGILAGIRASTLIRRINEQSLSALLLYDNLGRILTSNLPLETDLSLSPETSAHLQSAPDSSPIEVHDIGSAPYQFLYAPWTVRDERIGTIAVGLPTNFVTERISTSRDTFVILFSLLFITVAALGILVSRSIIMPVQRLVEVTRAIRGGDLTRRVELEIPDELGELGQSFDHMTDQLVSHNRKINELYVAQLEETARREAILTNIGDAVIVFDPDNKVLLRNMTARNLIRKLRRHPEVYREFLHLCFATDKATSPLTVSFLDQHFSVLMTPVCAPSGELLGHVIVLRDVTAIVQSERLKDEMILQLSHELRTPLTAARGYVDLLKMLNAGKLDEQSIGFVDISLKQMTVLEQMINEVIDVSAILADKFSLECESFDFVEMIYERIQEHKSAAEARELTLEMRLPDHEVMIEADEKRLAQVVDHLLTNATNYTLPGGSIAVQIGAENGHVHLSVVDSGVGIDPDEQALVFERMYRGRSADAGPTDARGLGLGLFISRRIVEAHQGAITLESEPERGTAVSIALPVHYQNGAEGEA